MTFHATFAGLHEFAALETTHAPLLIDPWLAAGSVTLLFGPPSAGKTMVTLTLANALARGAPLWDVYPCAQSRVLIVQADMNTALYQERVRSSLAALPTEGIQVLATDAMPFDICKLRATDLARERAFAPDIIFVDTLRKSHSFDENDSSAADRVYGAWRAMFPGAAFVFLHHTRKLPTSPDANRIIHEAFRGSGAWAASADTIIAQRRVRRANNANWLTRLNFVRTRSCAEPASVLLKLTPDLILETLAEAPADRALLEWVTTHPRATRAEAVRWLSGPREGAEPWCSQATAYRIWDRVIKGESNG